MIRNRTRAFALLAVLGLAVAAAGAAGAPARDGGEMPPDPDVRPGILPNGLRYVLAPRNNEPGHVSLRLIVQAGSLDERDDERGYAHFVEHMAFEGTTHYPAGRLVLFLQRLGLGFGADLNADTSFTHTIYKLDLPQNGYLPEALGILRDYADGLTFPPYALDRQRGVVLSEMRARATAQSELSARWIAALYAGTGLPARMPLGDEGLVGRADAARLRAFYQRCYRPERMIVLVAGDFAPDDVAALLRRDFASLAAGGRRPAPARPKPPAARGLTVDLIASPIETAAAADLTALAVPDDATRAAFHAWAADAVVVHLLNRRLAEQARADPRIGTAFVRVDFGPDQLFAEFRIEAQAAAEDWPAAVAVVETELRRARLQGFQPDELREAVFGVLAGLHSVRDEAATFRPGPLADRMAAKLALNRPWPNLDAEFADATAYLESLTPAEADAALAALFPDSGLHLIVRRPTPIDGGPRAVLAAYRASAARPLAAAAPAAAGPLLFHYGDMESPGAIARRQAEPDLRLDEVTFANAVRLNIRPSVSGSHRFALSARLGRGVADLSSEHPRIEFMAIAMILLSDLGRNSRAEITRLLQLHAVEFNFTLSDYQMAIDATGPADELRFTLRLLAAYLSDLDLQASSVGGALGQYAVIRNRALGSTESWADNNTYFRMASADPRAAYPAPAQVARYSFADIAQWTHRHWLGGPLEVGVTGDLDVDSTIAAAALTIGALPARLAPEPGPAGPLRLPGLPFRKTEYIPRPDQAAVLRVAWPAAGAGEIPVGAALQLAIDALVDRLRIQLREDLGATYSPRGTLYQAPDDPAFAFAWIELTFDPRRAEGLGARALALADDLATQGVSEEEFARLREPRRAQTAAQLASDFWWVQRILVRAQSEPRVLLEARTLGAAYAALTRDDVNRAAARFLHSSQASAILVMPASGSPAP